jgi:hypothetical protein
MKESQVRSSSAEVIDESSKTLLIYDERLKTEKRRGWVRERRICPAIFALVVVVSGPRAANADHNWRPEYGHPHPVRIEAYSAANTASPSCFRTHVQNSAYGWGYHAGFDVRYKGVVPSGGIDPAMKVHSRVLEWGFIDGPLGLIGEDRKIAGHPDVPVYTKIDQDDQFRMNLCASDTPVNKYDLWSIISHEMGHWAGLGDLTAGDQRCTNDNSRSTMCPGTSGTDVQRNPDTWEDRVSAITSSSWCNEIEQCDLSGST